MTKDQQKLLDQAEIIIKEISAKHLEANNLFLQLGRTLDELESTLN